MDQLKRPNPGSGLQGKWLHLLLIALFVAATHALWLGPHGHKPDEEFYAIQALCWLRGGPPAIATWDIAKTPVLPLIYMAAFRVGGETLVAIHVTVALSVFAIACVIYAIAKRAFSPQAGLAAALLYVGGLQLFSGADDSKFLNTELPVSLAVGLALWLVLRAERAASTWRLVGVGALCGVAVAVRQTSVLYVPVVLLGAWLAADRPAGRKLLSMCGAVLAGAVLPAAALVAYYARWGGLDELYTATVIWPLRAGGAIPLHWGVLRAGKRFAEFFLLGTPIPSALAAAYYLGAYKERATAAPARPPAVTWAMAAWLGAALLAVVPSWRFWGHYFVQVLPPLCIAGGGAVWLAQSASAHAGRLAGALVTVQVLAGSIALNFDVIEQRLLAGSGVLRLAPPKLPLDDLVDAVRRHAAPGQPIMVWGQLWPEVYWRTRCMPAARDLFGIVTAGYNFSAGFGPPVTYFPGAEEALVSDLQRSHPVCIVDLSSSPTWRRFAEALRPMRSFPLLDSYVQAEYEPTRGPGGAVLYLPRTAEDRLTDNVEHGVCAGRAERWGVPFRLTPHQAGNTPFAQTEVSHTQPAGKEPRRAPGMLSTAGNGQAMDGSASTPWRHISATTLRPFVRGASIAEMAESAGSARCPQAKR